MPIADRTSRVKFVHCDVTSWNDQVSLFRTAASMTSSNTIDHVVANAGIAIEDEVFSYEGKVSQATLQIPNHPRLLTSSNNRSRIPNPPPKPQNNPSKPPRYPLHHQTRPPLFHQTEWLPRTLGISTTARHQPDSHRFRSRFPRLSARSPVPKHQMGHPGDDARPPPHGALSR